MDGSGSHSKSGLADVGLCLVVFVVLLLVGGPSSMSLPPGARWRSDVPGLGVRFGESPLADGAVGCRVNGGAKPVTMTGLEPVSRRGTPNSTMSGSLVYWPSGRLRTMHGSWCANQRNDHPEWASRAHESTGGVSSSTRAVMES